MIQNLVFDWAGTLVDDLQLTFNVTNQTLTHFGGEPVDLVTYRREFQVPVMNFYGPRLPGRTLEEIDAWFFDCYRRRLDEVVFFEGVEDLIRLAHVRRCSLFVLTTVPAPIVWEFLNRAGLAGAFRAVHGNARDKQVELPGMVSQYGLERHQTLYVGDTPHDVAAALCARVRAAAALYGYASPDVLMAAGPDYGFRSVAELVEELDRDQLRARIPFVIATVGGIVADNAGRILLVQTRKWSNLFGIPGGKIDYGETMEAAYEREIEEECGLKLRDTRFVTIQDCIESPEFYAERHFLLINYYSRAVNPHELSINYESEQAVWVTPREAMEMPLNTPTRIALQEAARQGLIVGTVPFFGRNASNRDQR